MSKINVWQTNTVGENVNAGYDPAWFIGCDGDWGGMIDEEFLPFVGLTTVPPPIESTRDGHPCTWSGSAWVLLTSGVAFDRWASDKAKKDLASEDNLGNLQRTVEELVDEVRRIAPDSKALDFAAAKVAARKAKRAVI